MGSLKSDFDNKLRTIVIVSNSTQFRQRFSVFSNKRFSMCRTADHRKRKASVPSFAHLDARCHCYLILSKSKEHSKWNFSDVNLVTVRHSVRSLGNLQQHRKPRGPLFGLITTWWARYHVCPLLEPVSSLENSSLERLRTELLNVCHCKPYKFRIARYHL